MNIILNALSRLINREYRIEINKLIYEMKCFPATFIIMSLDFR